MAPQVGFERTTLRLTAESTRHQSQCLTHNVTENASDQSWSASAGTRTPFPRFLSGIETMIIWYCGPNPAILSMGKRHQWLNRPLLDPAGMLILQMAAPDAGAARKEQRGCRPQTAVVAKSFLVGLDAPSVSGMIPL